MKISGSVLIVLSFLAGLLLSTPESSQRILLENDRVRVREVIMEPGVEGDEHTHMLPHVGVIIRGGKLEFREAGSVEVVEFKAGDAGWRETGVTHSIVNLSDHPVHVVEVELKP